MYSQKNQLTSWAFTTHSLLSLTETQEYVDEIYDEDYYMAPSIMDPYVPPRECNKIEWLKNWPVKILKTINFIKIDK